VVGKLRDGRSRLSRPQKFPGNRIRFAQSIFRRKNRVLHRQEISMRRSTAPARAEMSIFTGAVILMGREIYSTDLVHLGFSFLAVLVSTVRTTATGSSRKAWPSRSMKPEKF